MINYKILPNSFGGFFVFKIDADGKEWSIPEDVNNIDWIEYQIWLSEGNEPSKYLAGK